MISGLVEGEGNGMEDENATQTWWQLVGLLVRLDPGMS